MSIIKIDRTPGDGNRSAIRLFPSGIFREDGRHAAAPRRKAEWVVITPHPVKMAQLLDMDIAAIEADPLTHARDATNRFGVVAVLKSARSHISGG